MATGSSLVNAIKAYRQVHKQENSHLSPEDLDKDWNSFWKSVSKEVTGNLGTGTMLPLKRPSSSLVQVGTHSSSPSSKRTGGHNCSTGSSSGLTAPYLQRQASAPAAPAGANPSPYSRHVMHPTPAASAVGSFSVPHPCAPHRRASNPTRPSSSFQSFVQPGLANIDEAPMYPTHRVLARSLDAVPVPPIWLEGSPIVERGEHTASAVVAPTTTLATQLTAACSQVGDSADGMLTPPISDSGLTTASTALSQPMTRSNTDDVLLHGVDMMRVDSQSSSELVKLGLGNEPEHEQDDLFLFDGHGTLAYDGFSYSAVDSSLSFSSEMKHCPSSQEDVGNTSSHHSVSVAQHSHLTVPAKGQELRRLEPKQSYDCCAALAAAAASDETHQHLHPHQQRMASLSEVRLVEMTLEDGTKVKKAEISRAARQQPQRKTTFCPHCNEQPQGFHGDHELNRHIDRQHRGVRKVWICKDISRTGFLDGCKACRNQKTYGANYNAAAHLRRAHFNPCKNKRGGRGKKSEGRGGIGGGNKPSMDELKNWMYAMYEIIVNGEVVDKQPIPPDGQDDIYAALVTPQPQPPPPPPPPPPEPPVSVPVAAIAPVPSPVTIGLSDMPMPMVNDFNFDNAVSCDQQPPPASSSSSSSSSLPYDMIASLSSGYHQMMIMAAMDPSAALPLQLSPAAPAPHQPRDLTYVAMPTGAAIYNE